MKKAIIILLTVSVVGGSVAYFVFGGKPTTEYITESVKKGKLIQTVSEVGTVKAVKEINLNFGQGGEIKNIYFKVGDEVSQGDILAELDYGRLLIKKKEAEANLDAARANLNKILKGATTGEVAVSRANADQAKSAHLSAIEEFKKTKDLQNEKIEQAEQDLFELESDLESDITSYEQAVVTAELNLANNKKTYSQTLENKKETALSTVESELSTANTALENIDRILNDNEMEDYLSVKNLEHLIDTKDYYAESLILLKNGKSYLDSAKLNESEGNMEKSLNSALACLNEVFSALNSCYKALDSSITSSEFTLTELNAHKTNISTQISSITSGISSLQSAKQNLADAYLNYQTKISGYEDALSQAENNLENAVKTAKNNLASIRLSAEQQITSAQSRVDSALEAWNLAVAKLDELTSPARAEDIALQRAKVKQAEANFDLVEEEIEDSLIKAPIEGKIFAIEFEVGEKISANQTAIKLLKDNNLEIEIDISEADISKIKAGQKCKISFDAFNPDLLASGQVYFVEPAETIIQDVIYYKVKVNFDAENFSSLLSKQGEADAEIKPGMTANVIITTAEKDNVLLAPSRSIIDRNGEGKFIRILEEEELVERQAEVGLRGDGNTVELLSGASLGDEAIVYIEEE